MWEEFTPLAREKGAVNLGQGFPDWPTPAFVKAAAVRALEDNFNQVRGREKTRPGFNHVRERGSLKLMFGYGRAVPYEPLALILD